MKLRSLRSGTLRQRGSLHYALPLLFVVFFGIVGVAMLVYSSAASQNCQNAGGSTAGAKIGSEAKYEYCVWQGGKNWQGNHASHETLLKLYTNGAPSEPWCADFVSYVFKQAGYAFKYGTAGWDEKTAASIASMNGVHKDPKNYKPKVGDVAYFYGSDYPEGHVEIVVATNPTTFIYGDTGARDPATGNGNMAKNTYTSSELQYYLSPN